MCVQFCTDRVRRCFSFGLHFSYCIGNVVCCDGECLPYRLQQALIVFSLTRVMKVLLLRRRFGRLRLISATTLIYFTSVLTRQNRYLVIPFDMCVSSNVEYVSESMHKDVYKDPQYHSKGSAMQYDSAAQKGLSTCGPIVCFRHLCSETVFIFSRSACHQFPRSRIRKPSCGWEPAIRVIRRSRYEVVDRLGLISD